MPDATATPATDGPVAQLAAAADEVERAEAAVEEAGEAALRAVADAHESFLAFIEENDGKATGSGREAFEAYVAFQDELVTRVERLPDDLLAREAFERVGELLDKRRLSPDDMERAREALEPAAAKAVLLEDRRAARRRYRRARSAVTGRLREVESAIDRRERLLDHAEADLDADLTPLRGPVSAYDDAVREAFREHKRSAPARELLDVLDAAGDYPLVPLEPAPDRLARYLRSHPAGGEPVHRLLELADYTPSKLEHYVEDPATFRATVAGHRAYLRGLDAGPLTVGWPPPPAAELRFRARELVAVVDRFAPEPVVARLHELRDLTRSPEYGRLREAAAARERLDPGELERLRSGAVAEELERLRDQRDRLNAALEAHPER